MKQIPDRENPHDAPAPAPVPAPSIGKPERPGAAPREISREEMDHRQPADADPDDPVSR